MPTQDQPISKWHHRILTQFLGRQKHAMLQHLRKLTGVAWEKLESEQKNRPRSVTLRLRDKDRKYETLLVRVTPKAGGNVKVVVGQMGSVGKTSLLPQQTMTVRSDAIPGARLFDWIPTRGLNVNVMRHYNVESLETPLDLTESKALGPQAPVPRHIKPEYHFLPQQKEGWNAGLKHAREYLADPPFLGQRGKQSMRNARRWIKQQKGEVTLRMILGTHYPANAPPPQLEAAEKLRGKARGKLAHMEDRAKNPYERSGTALDEQHIPFWAAVEATTQHVIDWWRQEPPSPPRIVKWVRAVAEKLLKEWEVDWEKKHPPKTGFERRVKQRLRRKLRD